MLLHILLPYTLIVTITVIYLVHHFCEESTSTSSRVENLNTMELALLMLHAISSSFVSTLFYGNFTLNHRIVCQSFC